MQTSLFTGISGLNANLSSMSVVGNNIANVNTIGFKSSRVTFSEVLSQTLSGTNQIGLGVNMSSIQKIFSQGAFKTTGNILDMAISGDGFFILRDPTINATYYSRAGQFQTDKDGYIVNPEGLRLQGYMANASGVLGNDLEDIRLSTNTVAPNPTSEVKITANLDSNSSITGYVFTSGSNDEIAFTYGTNNYTVSLITDGGLTSGSAYDGGSVAAAIKAALESQVSSATFTVTYDDQTGKFTVTNDSSNSSNLTLDWSSSSSASILGFNSASSGAITPGNSDTSDNAGGAFFLAKAGETSNFSTPITVYDSLGNAHVVTIYFRKDELSSVGNVWEWYAVVDSTDTTSGSTEIQARGTITFNTSGALYSESAITYPTGGFDFTGGADQDQQINFEFGTSIAQGGTGTDGTTQYGSNSAVSSLEQDGYAAGTLQRLTIDLDGILTGIFSNGRDRVLAQVLLADFPSPVGLSNAGRNLFVETYDSGQRLINAPGSAGLGLIHASTLELSNVDIAQEFVNMITAQRGFQANSRIITTTDDILAEMVNLKR